jgi:hypothetical protein
LVVSSSPIRRRDVTERQTYNNNKMRRNLDEALV